MYDYIIVGSGAGGATMAGRLSEDPEIRVLVLEAGPMDSSPFVKMPIAYSQLFKSRHDWDFATEAEPGIGGRSVSFAQGRLVGGSTSMNGMVYMRGGRADYDAWAVGGAQGWAYDDVLPYFRKSEDNERGEDLYHGVGGPLSVMDNRSRHQLDESFLRAAWDAGVPNNPDVNGASQHGVHWHQFTQRNGRRWSAADAFLHPALERKNLDLMTDTPVLRVLFEGRRAVGVEVLRDGRVELHHAHREVIVSAGTFQSAVLLMVSGIGPADELRPLGIEVLADLPVGRNLQDHLMTCVVYRTDVTSLIGAFTPENVALYETEGRGPLTSAGGEAGGFISTELATEGPDFQLSCIPALFDDWREVTAHGISIAGWPMRPTSVGSVRLRAADALTKPRIVHNYLTTEHDRRLMAAGMRRMLEIASQRAFKEVALGPFAVPESSTDDDILTFVRAHGATTYHPVGTCAIGHVVDPELRVIGVEGLRVVDASVMPRVTGGNTNAPTIMIAERAADLVKGR